MEDRIAELIEGPISDLGFELVKVTFRGGNRKALEVYIDSKNENKIQVGDCKKVSDHISAILDVEDIIKDKYFLEVSSAGLERPLIKLEDYERFKGRDIKLKLKEPHNKTSIFKGKIIEVKDKNIAIKSKNVVLTFAYDNIKEANLVLTEELFKQLLKK